jgi:enoyl-CoA hydratase/carnithine racemase
MSGDRPLVSWRVEDGIGLLRLEDGERSNALGPRLVREFRAVLAQADTAAIVLSAAGRNFCSGGDHRELIALDRADFRRFVADLIGLLADLAESPASVVAAVQGAAVGGGLELVLLSDFVVADHGAWFQLPYVTVGARIGDHVRQTLVARTGMGFARRIMLLGERIDAATAQAAGLVDRLVAPAELTAAATALAAEISVLPSDSLRRIRSDLAAATGIAAALRAEDQRRLAEFG